MQTVEQAEFYKDMLRESGINPDNKTLEQIKAEQALIDAIENNTFIAQRGEFKTPPKIGEYATLVIETCEEVNEQVIESEEERKVMVTGKTQEGYEVYYA